MKIIIIIWTIICILITVMIIPNSGFTKRDAQYYQKLCEESGAILQQDAHSNATYYEGGNEDDCTTEVILARSSTPEEAMEALKSSKISIYPNEIQKIDNKIQIISGTKGSINPFFVVIMFFRVF